MTIAVGCLVAGWLIGLLAGFFWWGHRWYAPCAECGTMKRASRHIGSTAVCEACYHGWLRGLTEQLLTKEKP